ncbi:hypothetical protein HWV62_1033 [Athelia sp. TMB]|nr:hypothetical protein HWV62_1033 [Athelia sp. TMB]
MQALVDDLGTTEILELYGKRLRAARDRNAELEKRLMKKTAECAMNARLAQKAEANRAALRQEVHRLTSEGSEPRFKSEPETAAYMEPLHALNFVNVGDSF